MMPLGLMIAILTMAALALALASTSSSSIGYPAKPGCNNMCGNLTIPYPFGMSEECYLNQNFSITCNTTHYNPPQAFVMNSDIMVTNISILDGELDILHSVAKDCNTQNDSFLHSNMSSLNVSMFTISDTKNKFTGMGCDTLAVIYGQFKESNYTSGCMALCAKGTTLTDGVCSGNGCCQLEIPKGLNYLELYVGSLDNSTLFESSPCGYAFVMKEAKFNFSKKYIQNFPQNYVPLVLDWTITTPNICGPNTTKANYLDNGSNQYRCQCLKGFEGNPYITHQGCQDINECENENHDCESKDQCVNQPGNYTCNCPNNYHGDGKKMGKGCTRNSKSFIPIIVGVGVGFIVLLISSSWLYLGYKKWKFIQKKDKFFKENGGLILKQHLSERQSPVDSVKIFSQEELDKATNKFHDSTVVGTGGYGTVHRGVLDSGTVVAIKKSKLVDQSQTSQFINEVIVLSQINHRHVVKLLGCCLETQVPLLVYEFITNGTLYDYIHQKTNHGYSLSWEDRLRIASETAGVISYLHSSASTPIIHRDIKTTNILLDENCVAKVSDFGASKLVPVDQTELSTMVQGTLGYLDPEYLLTSELTEKSDVYSFGIVLLELITGKKAVSFEGPEAERNLAMYVLCAMKEDRLVEVVDKRLVGIERNFDQIKEVGKLAKECVKIKGEERPSMKDVAMELEGLRVMRVEHSWSTQNIFNQEETVNLLERDLESSQFVDNSIKAQVLTHIPDAR